MKLALFLDVVYDVYYIVSYSVYYPVYTLHNIVRLAMLVCTEGSIESTLTIKTILIFGAKIDDTSHSTIFLEKYSTTSFALPSITSQNSAFFFSFSQQMIFVEARRKHVKRDLITKKLEYREDAA